MFGSLKNKILAVIVSIILIYTIVFMVLSYYTVKGAVQNQMKNDGATLITQLNRQLEGYSLEQKNEITNMFINVVRESKDNILYVSIVDSNMNILISSDDKTKETSEDTVSSASLNKDDSLDIATTRDATGFTFTTQDGSKVYNVSTAFYQGSKVIGSINVGISLEDMNKLIKKGMIETAIIAAVVLCIAIVVSIVFSNRLANPSRKLPGRFYKGV